MMPAAAGCESTEMLLRRCEFRSPPRRRPSGNTGGGERAGALVPRAVCAAGRARAKRTGAKGDRLKESVNINQGLLR